MTESPGGDAARFEGLGLYDPHDEHAERRLAVLRELVALGATDDELRDASEELSRLAFPLIATPGRERLTSQQLAGRVGTPEAWVVEVWQRAGFPRPSSSDPVFTEVDVELMRLVDAARGLFGDETTLQLMRVTGSAVAQVADAVISAFIVDLARHTMAEDACGLALLRANIDTLKLLPQFSVAMDTLLRHHLLALRRVDALEGPPGDFETQVLAVGFTDLVDSSGLAQQVSMSELGARLRQFETRAASLVMGGGGRVIKHIGDEVMFVSADPVAACRIALDLVGAFADDPALPSARSGVACGEVLLREGDCFGPVVNLAARLVEAATPNTLLVSDAVRDAVAAEPDLRVEARARQQLKGFADPLTVAAVSSRRDGRPARRATL